LDFPCALKKNYDKLVKEIKNEITIEMK